MTATLPGLVGVVGGGRMGGGIAHAFVTAGCSVTLIEVDEEAAVATRSAVRQMVRRSAERGTLPEGTDDDAIEAAMRRFRAIADTSALADADLVVEAVPENLGLKREVLSGVDGVTRDDAVIATNTSSLSIDDLAIALSSPERFLGLHFFNPVPASALVEIVTGAATRTDVVASAQGWVRALGKTPVTVKNSPGFASSRLGVALGLEAIRMLEEGVASAEDIDAAMVLGYRHPVGPLRLTDMVGLDVRLAVADYLVGQLGERFDAPALLRKKVAAGEVGQKAGQGFYSWG